MPQVGHGTLVVCLGVSSLFFILRECDYTSHDSVQFCTISAYSFRTMKGDELELRPQEGACDVVNWSGQTVAGRGSETITVD